MKIYIIMLLIAQLLCGVGIHYCHGWLSATILFITNLMLMFMTIAVCIVNLFWSTEDEHTKKI